MLLSRLRTPVRARTVALLACCLGLLAGSASSAEPKKSASKKPAKKPVITRLEVDPDAEQVDLFEGIERGDLDAVIRANGPHGGFAFIENKSDKPLTVQLPDAFVGVQVLEQFGMGGGMGGMGGGMGGMGMGGMGGMGGGMGGQGAQPMGGGMGGMGGGMGGMGSGMGGGMGGMGGMGGGGNFFSIPPEKVARVPYTSVCLAHGKPDPHRRMTYRMLPVDQFTSDPVLQEVIRLVGTGKLETGAAQAAAWHLTDRMTWQDLATKSIEQLGGAGSLPYFNTKQLQGAQSIIATAAGRARERQQEKGTEPARPVGTPTAATAAR